MFVDPQTAKQRHQHVEAVYGDEKLTPEDVEEALSSCPNCGYSAWIEPAGAAAA